MRGMRAVGDYEDFLTGFVTADGEVWGRPVGVAVGEGRRAAGHRRRLEFDLARRATAAAGAAPSADAGRVASGDGLVNTARVAGIRRGRLRCEQHWLSRGLS